MRDPEDLTPPERIKSLAAIMTSIGVAGIGMGLTGPLYSYAFEAAGYARTINGLNSAVFALAIIVSASSVPRAMRKFGTINILWLSQAAIIAALIVFRLTDSVWVWFLTKFVLGIGMTVLFVATEIWINLIAHEKSRGRVIGIYTVALSGGFTVGLTILYVLGSSGWPPVLVTVALYALAGLPLIPARHLVPALLPEEKAKSMWRFLRISPVALTAAIIFGAVEMGILNLLNIYGLRAGMAEGAATLMLLSTAAGNLIGPLILGILADRMDRRVLLLWSAGVGSIASILIPVSISNPLLLHTLLFITGGIIVGLYTVGLTLVGERFRGKDLAGANAAYAAMYGVGALFGPFMGGIAMDIWDPNGLMVVFFALCGGYSLMVFGRIRRSASLTDGAA